jgi:uncharacterized repeat protein (TIGR03803 family)
LLLVAAPPPGHAEGAKAVASITESPHQAALVGSSPDIPAHNGNPTFQILYNFCSQQPNCVDGTNPMTGLVIDGQGNLYGATGTNGAAVGGTVFQITPTPTGWVEKVIYEVAAGTGPILPKDGPSMTMDTSGNIYDVTVDGVFQLAPNPDSTTWKFTKIYTFCPQLGCNDGDQPNGELLIDGAGNLYGTTYQGGRYGRGTVFQLTPDPSGNTWTEKVLYSFCPIWPCTDGWNPESGLVIDSGGNLYGTTFGGGANNNGVVFQVKFPSNTPSERVLYDFCSQSNCADGRYPRYRLTMDGIGSLYGTAHDVAYKLTPNANTGSWKYSVLYKFCQWVNCTDGQYINSALIMDPAGNLYGNTLSGGQRNDGVVFQLTPPLSENSGNWDITVLHPFCSLQNCADGGGPNPNLIMDAAGRLYGTAMDGGKQPWAGVAFSIDTRVSWLSVTQSGPGRVTSSPAGIDCRNSCGGTFAPGTQITLTAVPDAGATFAGWAKDCSGTGNCTVTLDSDRAVYAVFKAPQPALSVSTIGSGTVAASEGGIYCGKICSARLPDGSTVTLSASPSPGWQFAGWSGACSGMGGCKVTLHGPANAAALFARQKTAVK